MLNWLEASNRFFKAIATYEENPFIRFHDSFTNINLQNYDYLIFKISDTSLCPKGSI